MPKEDRRVQRTCELLQQALIGLIKKRGYDAVTIQQIVKGANVGRTTFYLICITRTKRLVHELPRGHRQLVPHSPDLLAHTFHHLRRAAIRDALGISDDA